MKRKTKNMNWTYVSYPCLQQWRRSKHLTKEANNGDIRITKMRGFKENVMNRSSPRPYVTEYQQPVMSLLQFAQGTEEE